MAQDKDGELNIEKTASEIIGDILPHDESPPNEDPNLEDKGGDDTPSGEPKSKGEPPKEEPGAEGEHAKGDEGQPPAGEPEEVKAPKSWSKEIAPKFAKLEPDVREYINKREQEFVDGITQYKQAAEFAQAVSGILTPYAAHIQSRGVGPGALLKTLLNADYVLSNGTPQQKMELVHQIMQRAGLTKENLGDGPPVKDPNLEAIERRLQETNSKLSEYETAQLERTKSEVAKAVDAFAADPKNLYFAELSDDIVKLINAGYTLEEAYDKAMWANPSTRAKEQARLNKEAEAKRKKAAEEAALAAKKASRQNVKETPSSRKAATPLLGSMDDTLRETYRKINERTT